MYREGREGSRTRLRRLIVYYDPLSIIAEELKSITESLARLEIVGEAGVQITMQLRRIEEELDKLNRLLEELIKTMKDESTVKKKKTRTKLEKEEG